MFLIIVLNIVEKQGSTNIGRQILIGAVLPFLTHITSMFHFYTQKLKLFSNTIDFKFDKTSFLTKSIIQTLKLQREGRILSLEGVIRRLC